MKKIKLTALALAVLIALTGCKNANENSDNSDYSSTSSSTEGNSSISGELETLGAAVTVEDIKKAFNYDDSNKMMPLYNVSETEAFTFDFNFDAYDSDIGLYDFVSVHTDAACDDASAIYYTASLEVNDGKTTVTAAPMTPVLGNDKQEHDSVYEDIDSWGNAPIYYLAVHYSMEANKPEKLDSPVIIPFTVKHGATAPTLRGKVSADGRFSLEWDAVEGASKYIIYNLVDDKLSTGKDNHAIDGAKMGYDCGMNTEAENQLYLLKDDETTECTFDGFSGKDSHSLAEIKSDISGKFLCAGQNYSVKGEYYVTAVVNGVESGLSNAVSTADLVLPYTITEENEIKGRYPTPADFPTQVSVLNIDGSSTTRNITYKRSHVKYFEFEWDEYDYTVEGTHIYGSVGFEEDKGEPASAADTSAETGNSAPEDEVDRIPDSSVQTIIPTEDNTETTSDKLVEAQAENTKNHVENGNRDSVANVPAGMYINADTAEEKWLALNLVAGNTDISVEGFTALQNPYTLVDTFYKVYYQNPYIMGITGFKYDYNTLTFSVKFVYDKDTIAKKQEAIAKRADEIIKSAITSDMTDKQKADALYAYLEKNSVYDKEALEDAEKNDFKKTENNPHEDAFNTYGILVDGKGVCMSYAYSYRLLCDLAGVDCIVTTGYLNGNLPHAWNMVNLDGKWYEVDCTNNAVNSGIPYYLYAADSKLAEQSGYTKDDKFALDANVESFVGADASKEYYRANGLFPATMAEYKTILTNNITADTKVFAVRWSGEFNKEEFIKTVGLAYNELGLESKLNTLKYKAAAGFIILVND
ncbi:MAG: transglutaminase domain-containing protein [Oscillospiraceae bacterium]